MWNLEAISSLDKGTGSLVAGSPKLLTSRHGVTLSIYPLRHTNEIMSFILGYMMWRFLGIIALSQYF